MTLELRVFGGFVLASEGQPIKVRDRRARALLTFLSFADKPVPRAAVAALLASDDDGDGRAAVRQARFVVRQAAGDDDPIVDAAGTLALDPSRIRSDAGALTAALRGGGSDPLESVLAVYSGELLSGFRSPSEAFEEWLRDQRLRLDEQMITALLSAARRRAAVSAPEAALELARRALTIDPLCEEAHRETMRALTAIGRRDAARRQLARCRDRLRGELGVAPSAATCLATHAKGEVALRSKPRRVERLWLSVTAGAWADQREHQMAEAIGEALDLALGRMGHAVTSSWSSPPSMPQDTGLELHVHVAGLHGRHLSTLVRLQDPVLGDVYWSDRFELITCGSAVARNRFAGQDRRRARQRDLRTDRGATRDKDRSTRRGRSIADRSLPPGGPLCPARHHGYVGPQPFFGGTCAGARSAVCRSAITTGPSCAG